jgi:hypothetical protein
MKPIPDTEKRTMVESEMDAYIEGKSHPVTKRAPAVEVGGRFNNPVKTYPDQ